MIIEKMLEFLILHNFLRSSSISRDILYGYKNKYDIYRMQDRLDELEKEFLEPYVIDNAEKSE